MSSQTDFDQLVNEAFETLVEDYTLGIRWKDTRCRHQLDLIGRRVRLGDNLGREDLTVRLGQTPTEPVFSPDSEEIGATLIHLLIQWKEEFDRGVSFADSTLQERIVAIAAGIASGEHFGIPQLLKEEDA